MAKLVRFRLLAEGSQFDAQGIWAAFRRANLQDGAVEARVAQILVGRGSADTASARELASTSTRSATTLTRPLDSSDWITVVILDPGEEPAVGAGDTSEALEEDEGARTLSLQVGLVQTPYEIVPKLITDVIPAEKAPDVFIGGWVDTYIFHQSQMGLPGFEYALGEAGSWAGPAQLQPMLDTLMLSGDFSSVFTLTSVGAGLTQTVLSAGNDYMLVTEDGFVNSGDSMTVDARSLEGGNHVEFDGSAETDGRFVFFGSDSSDVFRGGAGDDSIQGLGGGDTLRGGGGSDTFVYGGATESTGAGYDTLGDFDPATDRIDLPGSVSGFASTVASGALSAATFDSDLATAVGGLGAGQAVWFAPDAGDRAGQIFLIVDGNGQAGYQAGEDYVFAIGGSPLADLGTQTGFFI